MQYDRNFEVFIMHKTYFDELQSKNFFKDYSSDHFIIKALKGNEEEIKSRLLQFQPIPITNIAFSKSGMPIVSQQQGLLNCSPESFILNSSFRIKYLHDFFGDSFDDFIKEQLAAGKENYTDEKFFQAMSEVHILSFLATFSSNIKNKIYEPQLGINGKNPEASFEFADGIKINIEVKTPDYSSSLHKKYPRWVQPSVAYDRSYSNLEDIVKNSGYTLIPPCINKIKDFINSACAKFQEVDHIQEFNLLAINYYGHPWGDMAIAEGYCSLMNETTGILYCPKTREELNISHDITRISAFVLYQCTAETLLTSDIRYSWPFMRLIRNPLCSDIDFEKLSLLFPVNRADYLLPKVIGGNITNLKTYIFHSFSNEIVNKEKIYQAIQDAQSLFVQ